MGIRKPIIKLLGGWGATTESLPFIRVLALGESDQTPNVTDSQLGKEIDGSRKLTATVPKVSEDGLSLTFSFLYDMIDDSVDNKDVKENGLVYYRWYYDCAYHRRSLEKDTWFIL